MVATSRTPDFIKKKILSSMQAIGTWYRHGAIIPPSQSIVQKNIHGGRLPGPATQQKPPDWCAFEKRAIAEHIGGHAVDSSTDLRPLDLVRPINWYTVVMEDCGQVAPRPQWVASGKFGVASG